MLLGTVSKLYLYRAVNKRFRKDFRTHQENRNTDW